VVSDSSRAIGPNAEVQCRNIGTSQTAPSKSSIDGEYTFQALEPGGYDIRVEAPGFKRARTGKRVPLV
jgi:Carboxypeptidase regulatory-like domain